MYAFALDLYYTDSIKCNRGGLGAGVPTGNNEFKQLSVFYGHSK